jgi:hypothetical protein
MSDLIKGVQKWLDEQGYPLEMKVASAFRAAGFEVTQAGHYIDPETGKSREIDIVAIAPDIIGITRIYFVLECKSSKKPWILFTSPEGHHRVFSYALASESARNVIHERFFKPEVSSTELFEGKAPIYDRLKWMRKDKQIGYAARQAHSDTDAAYAALLAAIKAGNYILESQQRPKGDRFTFVFPVVVIDAPLLRCHLDDTDQVRLEEIEEGEVYFSITRPDYIGTCIRIVTTSRLTQFALDARNESERLRLEFQEEEAQIRKAWHAPVPDDPSER